MVTILFAVVALIAFMDKASNDLLVDHREALNHRLRMEAYSALETTLSVLYEFEQVDNGLHSPAEGWNDPLTFAGYTPSDGRTVDVAFEDESGKISLPHADMQTLSRLFQSWQVPQTDADSLADALMGWMKRDYVYSTAVMPDYEQSSLPYDPPARPLRSYAELAAIDKVRDFFYDADGQPNDYYRRFEASVSLLDFARPNINGASSDTLAAVGQYDQNQLQQLDDYRQGKGQFSSTGPNYFQDASQATTVTGPGGNAGAFGTTISALRILITVHEGKSEFKLAAVICPPNAAQTVKQNATSQKLKASSPTSQSTTSASSTSNQPQTPSSASSTQTPANENLRYPFTLLEIRENDEIPPAPSPEPATPPS